MEAYMIMMIREQELIDQGREQGIAEGVKKGEDRFAQLIEKLFALNRNQDAVRAASDPEYRRQLYSELGF